MGKRVCCLFTVTFVCLSVFSQSLVTIHGNIRNKESNPVSHASVYLLNTHFFSASDSTGNFIIKNISAGDYTIVISAIGYATINEDIHVSKEAITKYDFQLADASKQLDEVIVTAEKKEE